jgi:hypothetical protein
MLADNSAQHSEEVPAFAACNCPRQGSSIHIFCDFIASHKDDDMFTDKVVFSDSIYH